MSKTLERILIGLAVAVTFGFVVLTTRQAPAPVNIEPPQGLLGEQAPHPRSPKWAKVRGDHLKAHNTCAACGTTKVLEVHHVKPFHLYPDLELESGNLITLCEHHHCHYAFGHNYSWDAYNPHVREDAIRQLSRVKNRKTE